VTCAGRSIESPADRARSDLCRFILICAGCLTFAYFKGKPLMTEASAEAFRQMAAVPLESDQLPQGQKDRINASIDRVVNGVKANEIGLFR